MITGFETENKYRIRNALGQQVYFAAESKAHFSRHAYLKSYCLESKAVDSLQPCTHFNFSPSLLIFIFEKFKQ